VSPEGGARLPDARQALLLMLVSLVLCLTLGLYFQVKTLILGIAATEVTCLLLPVVLALLVWRLGPRATLRLRWPGRASMVAALVAAPAAALLAGQVFWVQSLWLPLPAWYVEIMDALARAAAGAHPALAVAAVAVLPALGEETLFRGFLLTGLSTRFSPGASIAGTALLFAILHVDPYRFVAVSLLGAFFGFLVHVTGSLYPALLVHAVNNGLVLLPSGWTSRPGLEWLEGNRSAPVPWVLASAGVLLASGWVICRRPPCGRERAAAPRGESR
jgi:membrane protease YdiL (CAAX protease family)